MESTIDHFPPSLPPQLSSSDIIISPPSLLSFLDEKFQRRDDLLKASDLVSELQKQCSDLDQSLTDLNHKLETCIVKFASHSEQVGSLFDVINLKLNDLRSSTSCISEIHTDGKGGGGGGGEDLGRAKQIWGRSYRRWRKKWPE